MLDLEMLNLGSNYTVKYDAWNRLSTVADGSTVIQTNRYDGLHRRVSRESNTTGVRHFYWNEQWQCVEERTGTSTTADRQYVWHPYYIDALAISYNSSGTAHYYVQDGNFNVTAAMDSSGAIVERYSYTPYGECIVLNADFTLDSSSGGDGLSDIANEFTYTANFFSEGRRLDVETGLYQYRHRYYHAQLGRFVNRDPIGYEANSANLYLYVLSAPTQLVDSIGMAPQNPQQVAVGVTFTGCAPAETQLIQQAKQKALDRLARNPQCFANMRNASKPCVDQLHKCIIDALLRMNFQCDFIGQGKCHDGRPAPRAVTDSPCSVLKSDGANGRIFPPPGSQGPPQQCRPCQHPDDFANNCELCPEGAFGTITTWICRSDPGSRIVQNVDDLANILVHEASHNCVGGHDTTNIEVPGGRQDGCQRPDSQNIEETFGNCR